MKYKELIRNNIKFLIVIFFVILLGFLGITFALNIGTFKNIGINATTAVIDANITYTTGSNTSTVTSTGKMLPITDNAVESAGINIYDDRVLKVGFEVQGVSGNPSNTIYDVVIRNAEIDCELLTTDLKWQLYKNGVLHSSGNLSPTFDIIENGRLVLTEEQQELTTTRDQYVFLLWISDSCTSADISNCTVNHEKYLNKTFIADIKIEVSTKTPKPLVRKTGEEVSCPQASTYALSGVPVCNTLTYNGQNQVLVDEESSYTLINYIGTNAGNYAVTARINEGYQWSDGTTTDKILNCSIAKKNAVITAKNQSIVYGNNISNTVSDITSSGLINGHSISDIHLSSNTSVIGSGTITPSAAVIVSGSEDVTDNYMFTYNTGSLTISAQ